MSDKEFSSNDDLSLPKATVAKIITEILPPSSGLTASKDFRDAFTECCVEFIKLISSEANEISEREAKKTISAEHITAALNELGFPEYIDPILQAADEFKQQQAHREKKQSKLKESNMSEAELIRMQEELFNNARDKYTADNQGGGN